MEKIIKRDERRTDMDDNVHGGLTYRDTDSFYPFSIVNMYPDTILNTKTLIRPWYIRALHTLGRRLCALSVKLSLRWRRRKSMRYHCKSRHK